MNPRDLCDVGRADLCNPRGVTAVGSQAGFNLQPEASGELQSEGISGREADVSPRLRRHQLDIPSAGERRDEPSCMVLGSPC